MLRSIVEEFLGLKREAQYYLVLLKPQDKFVLFWALLNLLSFVFDLFPTDKVQAILALTGLWQVKSTCEAHINAYTKNTSVLLPQRLRRIAFIYILLGISSCMWASFLPKEVDLLNLFLGVIIFICGVERFYAFSKPRKDYQKASSL